MNGAESIPSSPYKGLARFDDSELDERFFFGRDRETELVAANLVASRLTVLYGPSGVGKSSLLRAGVVRRLRALVPAGAGGDGDGALPVVVDAWRDDPLAAIASAAGARHPETPEELADVLAERVAEVDGELYLVLDQMEEYFVYHGRPRGGPLREALAEVLGRPTLRVHVLLGIRDDALAELDAFKGRVPGLFGNVLRLDHLDVDSARAAILEPLAELEALGGPRVEAEPALVAAVVDQVASGRIERRLAGRGIVDGAAKRGRVEAPYLQLVMERLWEVERERGSSVLRVETLAELGGSGRIVQQHLERALAGLDAPERELVARLFHQLVTPSGTKIAHAVGDLSRYASEQPERIEDVLHTLSTERVVRALPGRNGGGARYEIYHDVLAGAVLDWGARHEAERALVEERAAARRRHRRLAAIIGFGAVALAVMGLLTAYAFDQRSQAREKAELASLAQARAERSKEEADANAAESRRQSRAAKASARDARDARDVARRQTKEAQRQTGIAREERAAANSARAHAERLAVSEAVARRSAETSRNEALASKNDALESKADALKERDNAKSAAKSERLQRARAVEAGARARARELVAEAIAIRELDPEQSLLLALRSAAIVSGPGLEDTLRDGLENARTRVVLPGGGGAVEFVEISSDGTRALVPGATGEARVFELSSGRLLARLRHGSRLTDAAFSPDSRWVFTGGSDGFVIRWDARSAVALSWFQHGAAIRKLAVSPDGRLVATAAGEAARVWRAEDGAPVARLPQPFSVDDVAFDPTGAQLLTLARDARLYDTGAWDRLPVVLDQPGRITTAAFAPVGGLVATGGQDDIAAIWLASDGSPRHQLRHRGDVLDLAWSPTGDLLATGSVDNGGRVFRAGTGEFLTFLGAHSNHVVAVGFSPDGASVVTASLDGSAHIWSGDGFARSEGLHGHSSEVLDAVFTPDGSSVVTGSDDGSARVWKSKVDPILSLVGRHTAAGRAVAISPGGGLIASVGLDGAVRLWRRSGEAVGVIAQPSPAVDVVFSRDGALLLTAGLDGVARVWGVGDSRLRQFFAHGAPLTAAAFDRDAVRVVTAGIDGIARIWSRAGGAPRLLRHGGGAVVGAVFSPDGRYVATAGANTEGRVWRAASAALAGKLTGWHDDDLTAIAYSPDGKLLVTSSIDADAHIWNAATFKHERALRGHSSLVSDVTFSPDGRWIATAGPTTVGLWKTVTGRRIDRGTPVLFLRGHGPRVRGVAFAPDSRRVVSIGEDATVRTYLCELCGTAPQLAQRARRLLGRLGANLTRAEQERYLGG